ncbi:hypothetical protein OW493_13690 [Cobetia sp. 14N.309.X.WAT.E.A4]|uniref:hypothetical protein n=1 Tax=Cobetia TaxID=204286 RepID=UPI0022FDB42A|nr:MULTISPECIES: hypothetical protein [unclassified Cobetia]MDA5565159.1 hypothetical protein [Cobetia sp. MMG027]MDN2657500.1 hypothetical protein [Cobetia sp. 14N.309.X.WAT.E.A4]
MPLLELSRRFILASCRMRHWLLLMALSLSPFAMALEAPQGPVVLRVTGDIRHVNAGDEAHFDRAMLQALPQRETVTTTPWHDGEVSFSGPLGSALMEAVGVDSGTMRIVALNDYAANAPVQDYFDYPVILAMQAEGKRLRVRDNGPIFIIYPFSEQPDLLNEEIMTRSVWQVKRIVIER